MSLNAHTRGESGERAYAGGPRTTVLRHLAVLAALLLPACINSADVDDVFCDEGEVCFENIDPACEDVEPGNCPDPLLAYDPDAPNLGSVLPDESEPNGAVVGRLEPFAVDTRCHTVIVGLGVNTGPCDYDAPIDLVVFNSAEVPTVGAAPVVASLEIADFVELGDNMVEVRFPFTTDHACGAFPFVGVRTRTDTCPLAHQATCDDSKGWRFDGDDWNPVSTSQPVQIYAGLDDCEPM